MFFGNYQEENSQQENWHTKEYYIHYSADYNSPADLHMQVDTSTLGMSIDIRKSGYRICGPISGYEKSQTLSENNKWMASRRWLRRCRWRKMRVDTVIVDTLAQLPAAAATVCGAECPVIGWGGSGSMHAASCKVSLSCSEWLSTLLLLLLLRHRPPAGATHRPPIELTLPLTSVSYLAIPLTSVASDCVYSASVDA